MRAAGPTNARALAEHRRRIVEEAVFLVSEVWLNPGSPDDYRRHLGKVTEILRRHGAEYVYHGHPFEWVTSPTDDDLPTGMQVVKFEDEARARAVVALLGDPELRAESAKVFRRTRTYLCKYAARPELLDLLRR
jgi:uncharacterized protein (DUF1330 family)